MANHRKAFIFITLFVIFSDAFFIWMNYRSAQQAMQEALRDKLAESAASFALKLDSAAESMQLIAAFVANQELVRDLFRQAEAAVAAEGGGAGGDTAAALRAQLLERVGPGWNRLNQLFSVRQLHFHLGPGSTSFLRVHRPNKFGDNMDDVRHTIVDANQHSLSTDGFETGRVYSGIRGVSPVTAVAPDTQQTIHVGAVEAGLAFPDLLQGLRQHAGAHYAVLLHHSHLSDNVWPDFLQRMYANKPPINDLYIEAATDFEMAKALLQQMATTNSPALHQTEIAIIKPSWQQDSQRPKQTLAVSSVSLRDYLGSREPTRADAGRVLIWIDATQQQANFEQTVILNITIAIIAFIIFELILFFIVKWVVEKLQSIIDLKTEQLAENNQALQQSIQSLKEKEAKLIQSEKLASVGQLAAGVAHEINNPIAYIKSNLKTLRDYFYILTQDQNQDTSKTPPDEDIDYIKQDLKELLEESDQGIDHVQEIVQDLKDFARPGETQWTEADLNQGIIKTLRIIGKKIPENIIIKKTLTDIPSIQCQPYQLNQVFLNIIINAIQAMPNGGTLTINTRQLEDQVLVEIHDQGIGIPEDVIDHIFEPFFTTKPIGQGSGLGLSVSYNIIQSHHGHIDVASTTHQGACFSIYLPIHQNQTR